MAVSSTTNLRIVVEVDTRNGIRSLREFGDETEKTAKKASESLGTVNDRLSSMYKALAASAVVASLGLIAAKIADVGSQFEAAEEKMRAALGLTAEEAERMGNVMENVYGSGLAESAEQAADVMIQAFHNIGNVGDEELGKVSQAALRISGVFGEDTEKTLNAVGTLMKEFGMSSQEALDFVSAGFQKGLNTSGDFLDSVTEYATQFSTAGSTAGQFFSVMETGLSGGVLGTDKAADALAEFRKKLAQISDSGSNFSIALTNIGMNSEEMNAKLKSGSVTATEAFQQVITQLNKVDDANVKTALGAEIIGTQYEDLAKRAGNIDITKTSMENLAGATATLKGENETLTAAANRFGAQLSLIANDIFQEYGSGLGNLVGDAATWLEQHRDDFLAAADAAVKLGELLLGGGILYAGIVGIPALVAAASSAMMAFNMSLLTAHASSALLAGGLTTVKAAGGVLMAAAAGWQIGSWLYDNFETARLAGLAMVEGLIRGWINFKAAFVSLVAGLALGVGEFAKVAASAFSGVLSVIKTVGTAVDFYTGTNTVSKIEAVQTKLDSFAKSESELKSVFTAISASHNKELEQCAAIIEGIRKEHTARKELTPVISQKEKAIEKAGAVNEKISAKTVSAAQAEAKAAEATGKSKVKASDDAAKAAEKAAQAQEKALAEQERLTEQLYSQLPKYSEEYYSYQMSQIKKEKEKAIETFEATKAGKKASAEEMSLISQSFAEKEKELQASVLKAILDNEKEKVSAWSASVKSKKDMDFDSMMEYQKQLDTMQTAAEDQLKSTLGVDELTTEQMLEIARSFKDERMALSEQFFSSEKKQMDERAKLEEKLYADLGLSNDTYYQKELTRIEKEEQAYRDQNFSEVDIETWKNKEIKELNDKRQSEVEKNATGIDAVFRDLAKGNIKTWEDMTKSMTEAFKGVGASGKSTFGDLFGWISNAFGKFTGSFGSGLSGIWDSIKGVFSGGGGNSGGGGWTIESALAAATGGGGGGGGIMSALGGLLGGGSGGGISTPVSWLINQGINSMSKAPVETLLGGTAFGSIAGLFKGDFGENITGIVKSIPVIGDFLGGLVGGVFGKAETREQYKNVNVGMYEDITKTDIAGGDSGELAGGRDAVIEGMEKIQKSTIETMESFASLLPENVAMQFDKDLKGASISLGGAGWMLREEHIEDDVKTLLQATQEHYLVAAVPALESAGNEVIKGFQDGVFAEGSELDKLGKDIAAGINWSTEEQYLKDGTGSLREIPEVTQAYMEKVQAFQEKIKQANEIMSALGMDTLDGTERDQATAALTAKYDAGIEALKLLGMSEDKINEAIAKKQEALDEQAAAFDTAKSELIGSLTVEPETVNQYAAAQEELAAKYEAGYEALKQLNASEEELAFVREQEVLANAELAKKFAEARGQAVSEFSEKYNIGADAGKTSWDKAKEELATDAKTLEDTLVTLGMPMEEAAKQAAQLGEVALVELSEQFEKTRKDIVKSAEALAGFKTTEVEKAAADINAQFDDLIKSYQNTGDGTEDITYLENLRAQALANSAAAFEKANLDILTEAKKMAGGFSEAELAIMDVNSSFESLRQQMVANGATAEQYASLEQLKGQTQMNSLLGLFNAEQDAAASATADTGSTSSGGSSSGTSSSEPSGPTPEEQARGRASAIDSFRQSYIDEAKNPFETLIADMQTLGGNLIDLGMTSEEASATVRELGTEALERLIEQSKKAAKELLTGFMESYELVDTNEFNSAFAKLDTDVADLSKGLIDLGVSAEEASAKAAELGEAARIELVEKFRIAREEIASSFSEKYNLSPQSDYQAAFSELDTDISQMTSDLVNMGLSMEEATDQANALGTAARVALAEKFATARRDILSEAREIALPIELTELESTIAGVRSQFAGMRETLIANGASATELAQLDIYETQRISNVTQAAYEAQIAKVQQFRDQAISAFEQLTDTIANNIKNVQESIAEANFTAGGGSSSEWIMQSIQGLIGKEGATGADVSAASGMLSQWYSAAVSEAQATAQEAQKAAESAQTAAESTAAAAQEAADNGEAFVESVAKSGESFADYVSVAVSSLEGLVKEIDDTINGIKYSDLNVGTKEDKAALAQADYEALKTTAMSGTATEDQMKEFMSFSKEYLKMQQDVHKSSDTYQGIYAGVMSDLESLKTVNVMTKAESSAGSDSKASTAEKTSGTESRVASSVSAGGGATVPVKADLSGIQATFQQLTAQLNQRLGEVESGEFLMKIDWSGFGGDAQAFTDILAPVVAKNGWDSQVMLEFLSETKAFETMPVREKLNLVGIIGEQAGWDSEALLAMASNTDFFETMTAKERMEAVGMVAANAGWGSKAVLQIGTEAGLFDTTTAQGQMEAIGLVAATAGWDSKAVFEFATQSGAFETATAVTKMEAVGMVAANAGWGSKAVLDLGTEWGLFDTTTAQGRMEAIGLVAANAGWDSKAVFEFATASDAFSTANAEERMEAIGLVAANAGWDSKAVLDLGTEWGLFDTTTAEGRMAAIGLIASKAGWDSDAVLALKSEWGLFDTTDVGTALDNVGINTDTGKWDSGALLAIASDSTKFVTTDVSKAMTDAGIDTGTSDFKSDAKLTVKSDDATFSLADFDKTMKAMKFIGQGAGWNSPAMLSFIESVDFEKADLNKQFKALGVIVGESGGWESPAALAFISRMDLTKESMKNQLSKLDIIVGESGGWESKATLAYLSRVDLTRTKLAEQLSGAAEIADKSGSWESAATIAFLSRVDLTRTKLAEQFTAAAEIADKSGSWESAATIAFLSRVDLTRDDLASQFATAAQIADKSGSWESAATLAYLSRVDLTRTDLAGQLATAADIADKSGSWESAATLAYLSKVDLTRDDLAKQFESAAQIKDKSGSWESQATLAFIDRMDVTGETVDSQFEVLAKITRDPEGGWSSKATLKFVDKMDFEATDINTQLDNLAGIARDSEGFWGSEASIKMVAKMTDTAEGAVPWGDLEEKMKEAGAGDTDIAKTIEGIYKENGLTLDDLNFMLKESTLSQDQKQEILASVTGIPSSIGYDMVFTKLGYDMQFTALGYNGPAVLSADVTYTAQPAADPAPELDSGLWRVSSAEMPALIHQNEIVVRPEHSDYVRGFLADMGFASAYGAANTDGGERFSFADGYMPPGGMSYPAVPVPVPVPVQGKPSENTSEDSKKIIDLLKRQIDRQEETIDAILTLVGKDDNIVINVDADGIATKATNTIKERLKRSQYQNIAGAL
jgi:hypothetical protein